LHQPLHQHPPLPLPRRISVTLLPHLAHAATSASAPDIDDDNSSHVYSDQTHALGYLDIGRKGYHLVEHLTSFLYTPSFCAATPYTTFPLGISLVVLLQFISSLTVCDAPIVHDATTTTQVDVGVCYIGLWKDWIGI
jgi:hypothetical protein